MVQMTKGNGVLEELRRDEESVAGLRVLGKQSWNASGMENNE